MLAQYCMLRAAGADVGMLAVVLGAPLVALVTLLPITVNGLFLAEGAFVLIYASTGIPAEVALAAAILRRLVDLANSGLGSVLWLAWQLGPAGLEQEGLAAQPSRSSSHLRYGIGAVLVATEGAAGGRQTEDQRAMRVQDYAGDLPDAAFRRQHVFRRQRFETSGPVYLLDLRGPPRAGPRAAQSHPVVRRPKSLPDPRPRSDRCQLPAPSQRSMGTPAGGGAAGPGAHGASSHNAPASAITSPTCSCPWPSPT